MSVNKDLPVSPVMDVGLLLLDRRTPFFSGESFLGVDMEKRDLEIDFKVPAVSEEEHFRPFMVDESLRFEFYVSTSFILMRF